MLRSDNILLRKLEPRDLPFLYQWENDSDMWPASDTHNPLSQLDLRTYIESSTGDIYKDGQLRLIIEQTDGATVGCIDLFDFDIRNQKAALGIYIAKDARQKHIATEAVHLVEDYAFRFLQIRMLYAVVQQCNLSAISLFLSAGWQQVATLPMWTRESDALVMITLP